jgi:multicomponent Na+:H+ antiporter subunit F
VVILGLNVLVGSIRVLRGPTRADRLIAVQLLGTVGVGISLLLAERTGIGAARDVALVLVILATVTTAVFFQHSPRIGKPPDDPT